MAESIWAKIGGAVKKGGGVVGNVLLLAPKAFIYPIRKPFASWDEMKHDAKVSLKEAVGIGIPEEEKKYDPPIKTTQASENLGVKITEQGKGKVTFLASRTLTGDIPYLTPEQLGKIKQNLPNVTIFREANKIVIEVDVEKIIEGIKNKSEHKGKSPEEIKQLVIGAIYGEVDRNFKSLAEITGGEFKIHTDRKLLHGIAEKLYREYDNQSKPTETVVPGEEKSSGQPSEASVSQKPSNTMRPSEFNMTNPNQFPFGKETISPTKMQSLENQVREWGSTFSNLEDVSGEAIKPLSTPDKEKEGKSRS